MFIAGKPNYMTLACLILLMLTPVYGQVSMSPSGDEFTCLKPAEIAKRVITCTVTGSSLMWKVQTAVETSSASFDKNSPSPHKLRDGVSAKLVSSSSSDVMSSLELVANSTVLPVSVWCQTDASNKLYTLQNIDLPNAPVVDISCQSGKVNRECTLNFSSEKSDKKPVEAYVVMVKSDTSSQVLRKPGNETIASIQLDYGTPITIQVEAQNCAGLSVTTVEVKSEDAPDGSSSKENLSEEMDKKASIAHALNLQISDNDNETSESNLMGLQVSDDDADITLDSHEQSLHAADMDPQNIPESLEVSDDATTTSESRGMSLQGSNEDAIETADSHMHSVQAIDNEMAETSELSNSDNETSESHEMSLQVSDDDLMETSERLQVSEIGIKASDSNKMSVQVSGKDTMNTSDSSLVSDDGDKTIGSLIPAVQQSSNDTKTSKSHVISLQVSENDTKTSESQGLSLQVSENDTKTSDEHSLSLQVSDVGLSLQISENDTKTSDEHSLSLQVSDVVDLKPQVNKDKATDTNSNSDGQNQVKAEHNKKDEDSMEKHHTDDKVDENNAESDTRNKIDSQEDMLGLMKSNKDDLMDTDFSKQSVFEDKMDDKNDKNRDLDLHTNTKIPVNAGRKSVFGPEGKNLKSHPFDSDKLNPDRKMMFESERRIPSYLKGTHPFSKGQKSSYYSEKMSQFDQDRKSPFGQDQQSLWDSGKISSVISDQKSPFTSRKDTYDSERISPFDLGRKSQFDSERKDRRFGSVRKSPFDSGRMSPLDSGKDPFNLGRETSFDSGRKSPFDSERNNPFDTERKNAFDSGKINTFDSGRMSPLDSDRDSPYASYSNQFDSGRRDLLDSNQFDSGRRDSFDSSSPHESRSSPYSDQYSPYVNKYGAYGESRSLYDDKSVSDMDKSNPFGDPFGERSSYGSHYEKTELLDSDRRSRPYAFEKDGENNEMDKDKIDSHTDKQISVDKVDNSNPEQGTEANADLDGGNSPVNSSETKSDHRLLGQQEGNLEVSTDNSTLNSSSTEYEVTSEMLDSTTVSAATAIYSSWYHLPLLFVLYSYIDHDFI